MCQNEPHQYVKMGSAESQATKGATKTGPAEAESSSAPGGEGRQLREGLLEAGSQIQILMRDGTPSLWKEPKATVQSACSERGNGVKWADNSGLRLHPRVA